MHSWAGREGLWAGMPVSTDQDGEVVAVAVEDGEETRTMTIHRPHTTTSPASTSHEMDTALHKAGGPGFGLAPWVVPLRAGLLDKWAIEATRRAVVGEMEAEVEVNGTMVKVARGLLRVRPFLRQDTKARALGRHRDDRCSQRFLFGFRMIPLLWL